MAKEDAMNRRGKRLGVGTVAVGAVGTVTVTKHPKTEPGSFKGLKYEGKPVVGSQYALGEYVPGHIFADRTRRVWRYVLDE